MEGNKESILAGYPNVISYECTQKIMEQMEKNICKIEIGEEQGTGFFTKIPFPDKNNLLSVFITNNHILNEKVLYTKDIKIKLDIKMETNKKEISLNNRIKYTNKEYDITIIEIKEDDEIKNYLELDDIIIEDLINNNNKNNEYLEETIYIIQYPEGKLSVSYGILNNIYEVKKYNFNHKCSTKGGSSGSPILNINNKIIGIHIEGYTNKSNKGTFLNYPIKEFTQLKYNDNEILLKEFNKKYNLNINNTKIKKLDLSFYNLGNEVLKDLCKIEFKELKELCLFRNKISDIKVLENAKFEKLEILNLGSNEISDINILEKVNFKELKELDLCDNKISDIKVLENVKFEKLEKLSLGGEIIDIDILEKVNFKELKELFLYGNKISDIKVLENVKFEKLEILNLSYNKISDINIFEKVNFKELKGLYLFGNNITDIKVLEKVTFLKLKILQLDSNKISDINTLEKVNFKILKELHLEENNISDIKVLENAKFEKLEILNLSKNKISDINILEKVNFKKLKELNLQYNNITDIKVFENSKFPKLEILKLCFNKIDKTIFSSLISNLESELKEYGLDI